jgi:antitoxin (DNA-binding transcriptional repressor) of toxin-antitoxin stability system
MATLNVDRPDMQTMSAPSDVEPETIEADEGELREGLEQVLPPVLVSQAPAARGDVSSLMSHASDSSPYLDVAADVFAAALGSSSATPVAAMLVRYMSRKHLRHPRSWLTQVIQSAKSSKLTTLTDFSTNRNRYVKDAEEGNAVFLTRRGTVVAALVPVERGLYESEVIKPALQRLVRRAEEDEEREITPQQMEHIENQGLEAAEELGVDSSGWAYLSGSDREASNSSIAE